MNSNLSCIFVLNRQFVMSPFIDKHSLLNEFPLPQQMDSIFVFILDLVCSRFIFFIFNQHNHLENYLRFVFVGLFEIIVPSNIEPKFLIRPTVLIPNGLQLFEISLITVCDLTVFQILCSHLVRRRTFVESHINIPIDVTNYYLYF